MRPHDYAPRPAHLKWLLDSDPAIRWQVMWDLTDEAPSAIAEERSRVATGGWGAKLLARQSSPGNGGEPNEDRGLLITLYSLLALMDLGLDPASKQAGRMIDLIDKRLVFKPLNSRPFLRGETKPCINGRILAIGAYFGETPVLSAKPEPAADVSRLVSIPVVGGLHHRFIRVAAKSPTLPNNQK